MNIPRKETTSKRPSGFSACVGKEYSLSRAADNELPQGRGKNAAPFFRPSQFVLHDGTPLRDHLWHLNPSASRSGQSSDDDDDDDVRSRLFLKAAEFRAMKATRDETDPSLPLPPSARHYFAFIVPDPATRAKITSRQTWPRHKVHPKPSFVRWTSQLGGGGEDASPRLSELVAE